MSQRLKCSHWRPGTLKHCSAVSAVQTISACSISDAANPRSAVCTRALEHWLTPSVGPRAPADPVQHPAASAPSHLRLKTRASCASCGGAMPDQTSARYTTVYPRRPSVCEHCGSQSPGTPLRLAHLLSLAQCSLNSSAAATASPSSDASWRSSSFSNAVRTTSLWSKASAGSPFTSNHSACAASSCLDTGCVSQIASAPKVACWGP